MTKKIEDEMESPISDDLSGRLEKIRQRAHELYEARGRNEGHEVEDWLQAEAEIDETKTSAAKK